MFVSCEVDNDCTDLELHEVTNRFTITRHSVWEKRPSLCVLLKFHFTKERFYVSCLISSLVKTYLQNDQKGPSQEIGKKGAKDTKNISKRYIFPSLVRHLFLQVCYQMFLSSKHKLLKT